MEQKRTVRNALENMLAAQRLWILASPAKPRQDEDGREFIGSPDPEPDHKYNSIGEQGISNRLAEEEHAFPESDEPRTASDTPRVWRQRLSNRAETAEGFEPSMPQGHYYEQP